MLGSVEESMNSLAETSAGWANEASKYAETAKRKAVMGGECSLGTCDKEGWSSTY